MLSYWRKSYFVRYFGSNVYRVGPWEGSLNRTFPVHTLLCLYVRSFLGILYPLRAYFYGRASFFCPEGCLIARQSKYNCLAIGWPCLWNGRWIGYWMPIIICIKEWIAEDFCKYVKCLKLLYGGFRHFLKEFYCVRQLSWANDIYAVLSYRCYCSMCVFPCNKHCSRI